MLSCICFLNEKEIICYEKKSGILQSTSDPGFPADARKTSLVRNQFKDSLYISDEDFRCSGFSRY